MVQMSREKRSERTDLRTLGSLGPTRNSCMAECGERAIFDTFNTNCAVYVNNCIGATLAEFHVLRIA